MWMYLGLLASVFLGVYDVCKKHALNGNAVLPVLFFATLCGSVPFCLVLLLSGCAPDMMVRFGMYVPPIDWETHGQLALKAFIVDTSWVLAYFALKHLPISIVAPIRASGPVWTILGATLLFSEMPSVLQWLGLAVIFISYYIFSLLGAKEGIHFHRNKWVYCIALATLIGTLSSLYDKYLLQQCSIPPLVLQTWFAVYLVLFLLIVLVCAWYPHRKKITTFQWRWSIPCIGLLLMVADGLYFYALAYPEAYIIILSAVRRCSVVFSFVLGIFIFRELNIKKKSWALSGVLLGLLILLFS